MRPLASRFCWLSAIPLWGTPWPRESTGEMKRKISFTVYVRHDFCRRLKIWKICMFPMVSAFPVIESRWKGGILSSQLFKISGVQHFVPWTWKLLPPGDFGLLDGQNCSFEADVHRQYINAAELLVRQNQTEETTKVFSFLAHMESNEYLLNRNVE